MAAHATGFVPMQAPLWQLSVMVHASPSVQPVPSAAFGFEHIPVAGLHMPATWHGSSAAHCTGLPPLQAPFWQVSVWLQAFASLHAVPFAALGFEHMPVAGLHAPGTWHWSSAAHCTGLPPLQAPFWQVSVWVQALA